ncbi:HAMP domain-containing histidine kinase [Jiella sp. MQZ9-1]|uniref:histidine kinase n=1 Tax=Jiella flava TaxID=2816857 RepID=A0A939FY59_9HYPH|nr:HAMP domain-containing sensor histidine kinase [Jiella flava]MBO0663690.1 HAMP domain-containing histidine kinase [Jiella flava]MCD2472263.1 HAMP domain-containing histidine kinase [Jiella flava]
MMAGKDTTIFRLSITRKVFLVGAIPIVLAVALGIAATVLFDRADHARRGALTVSNVFRHVVSAMSAQTDFIQAEPMERSTHLGSFLANAGAASAGLGELDRTVSDPDQRDAITATINALNRFRTAMGELETVIAASDRRTRRMNNQLGRLRALVEAVRARGSETSNAAAGPQRQNIASALQAINPPTPAKAQDVAVQTILLADKSEEAMRRHKLAAIADLAASSGRLRRAIGDLLVAASQRSGMLEALDSWQRELTGARADFAIQNAILRRMVAASNGMVFEVSNLNASLSRHAEAAGDKARQILAFSAAIGLAVAVVFGLVVAGSITRPLKRLEQDMRVRAAEPAKGALPEAERSDEIGRMARATNHFLAELQKREGALRRAKDETDTTLAKLKRTQSELLQREKLASLGQLVAGIAHEINTPLGVALTTATVMRQETEKFGQATAEGKVTRQAFDDFIARTGEGARLVNANLDRAAELVASFKQVAADQASGERRAFMMSDFLDDLFRSLGPMRRRFSHRMTVDCAPDIVMISYPGALSQVLTNLLTNAYAHGFAPGDSGTVSVKVEPKGADRVAITFCDDGRGIAAEHQARIFDPFFTTGRGSGSTGLGLHIIYNLVTGMLSGSIKVDSTVGKGTCFTIDIPRERPETETAARHADAIAGGRSDLTPDRRLESRPARG